MSESAFPPASGFSQKLYVPEQIQSLTYFAWPFWARIFDIGLQDALVLLEEIKQGAVVDSTHQVLSICSSWWRNFFRCLFTFMRSSKHWWIQTSFFLQISGQKSSSETRENGMRKWFLKLPCWARWSRTWWTYSSSQPDETSKDEHHLVVQLGIAANSNRMSEFFTWIQGTQICFFPPVGGPPVFTYLSDI